MMHIPKNFLALALAVAACVIGACCLIGWFPYSSDSSHSMMLDLKSIALKNSDLEEAGVLFLKSKVRFQLDRIVFPPADTGSGDPAVLKSALSSIFGSSIKRDLMEDPKTFLKVVKRIENWQPKYPVGYDPGWKFKHKISDKKIAAAIEKLRKEMLPPLRNKAILLSDDGYQSALGELADIRKKSKQLQKDLKLSKKEKAAIGEDTSDLQTQIFDAFWSGRAEEFQQLQKLNDIQWDLLPESRWHNRVGWKAENFFEDPKVIELCQAIEANDLEQMQKLIDDGVDVNARGEDNMTPLMWSYSDYKFQRFQLLLKAGADPNVYVSSEFNIGRQKFHPDLGELRILAFEELHKGSSVNMMAYQAADSRYAWAVLNHGGNVNQIEPKTGRSPLHFVMNQCQPASYKDELDLIKALIAKKANVGIPDPYRGDQLPLQKAINYYAYGSPPFELATILVEAGANPNAKGPGNRPRPTELMLIHKSNSIGRKLPDRELLFLSRYEKLKKLMIEHGADFELALAELDNGPAWGLALRRRRNLEELLRLLIREREYPEGKAHVYNHSAGRYGWRDYKDQNNNDWEKYYSHKSPDFVHSPHRSAIAFSIKHVSKDELEDMKTSLPDFAALGDNTVLFKPSYSGFSKWLDGDGGHLVDYLRSLAVKRCKLMERTSSDFPDVPDNNEGYYFLEVATNQRHHELLIPAEYLLDEELRSESGLEDFADIWELLEKLKMRAMVGDTKQTGRLFSKANEQLMSKFPKAENKFYIQHLTSARFDKSGKLYCKMRFSENISDDVQRIYSATCTRDNYKLTVEITGENDAFP